MKMSTNSSSISKFTFTIEQWELIRRLKSSGITKEQVVDAFDDIDRVAIELGAFCSSEPVANGHSELLPPNPSTSPVDELAEFKNRRNEEEIRQEICRFILFNGLKQSQVARMAGVNQAYVSKFMRNDIKDLSVNGRNLIYRWYLRYKNENPGALPAPDGSPQPKVARREEPPNFMVLDTLRKPRISFKPEHLEILERQFTEDPYPDMAKRAHVADECNRARADRLSLRESEDLHEEKVTLASVTNWFQNKRFFLRNKGTARPVPDSAECAARESSMTSMPGLPDLPSSPEGAPEDSGEELQEAERVMEAAQRAAFHNFLAHLSRNEEEP